MNDIIANVAQELADHLDELRDTGEGVPDFDGEDRSFPVTEVGDPELETRLRAFGGSVVNFHAVVGGQRVLVRVGPA